MERVIITTLCYHGTDCRVAAWQSNGKISRICLEDPRGERLLGSIHVGKVQKILPDIKGAFVEIENRTSCYFPYTKESNFLHNAEEIIRITSRRRTSGADYLRSDKNQSPASLQT